MPNNTTQSPRAILCFRDLLIGRLMYSYWCKMNEISRQTDLFDRTKEIMLKHTGRKVKGGLFNQFINDRAVTPIYTLPISGNPQLQASIRALRNAGILEPQDPNAPRARYKWASEEAKNFIRTFDPSNWSSWPVRIILDPTSLSIKKTSYVKE